MRLGGRKVGRQGRREEGRKTKRETRMVAGTCRPGVKEGRWENGRMAEREGDKENE